MLRIIIGFVAGYSAAKFMGSKLNLSKVKEAAKENMERVVSATKKAAEAVKTELNKEGKAETETKEKQEGNEAPPKDE